MHAGKCGEPTAFEGGSVIEDLRGAAETKQDAGIGIAVIDAEGRFSGTLTADAEVDGQPVVRGRVPRIPIELDAKGAGGEQIGTDGAGAEIIPVGKIAGFVEADASGACPGIDQIKLLICDGLLHLGGAENDVVGEQTSMAAGLVGAVETPVFGMLKLSLQRVVAEAVATRVKAAHPTARRRNRCRGKEEV
jgi:hypothetical protein